MPLTNPAIMSATKSTSQSSSVKPSQVIEPLPSNIARIVSQAHPAVILAAYCIRFPAFVADPVSTLLRSIPPLAIIQFGYAFLCLPPTGSSLAPTKKPKPGAKRAADAPINGPLTAFFALLLSVASVPVLAAIQVLFGAPITTHIPHTLLSSAHLALLAIFPLVYVHGSDGSKWREIASFYSPIDEVFGGAVGCCLGAWLGAVPIPLDWDREWQKWPVTIVTGAYAGYLIGKTKFRRPSTSIS